MSVRNNKAEQTKKKLLDAACQIIREDGFQKLSANNIVKIAQVSKGGFFHHFPQIDDLYLYMLEELIAGFEAEIAPETFSDFPEFMRISTKYTIMLLDQSPEIMTALFYFLSESRHKPEYQKRLQFMIENSFQNWAAMISHHFTPPLKKAELEAIIRITDMFFSGFSLHYMILKDKEHYLELSSIFSQMIMSFVERSKISPVTI